MPWHTRTGVWYLSMMPRSGSRHRCWACTSLHCAGRSLETASDRPTSGGWRNGDAPASKAGTRKSVAGSTPVPPTRSQGASAVRSGPLNPSTLLAEAVKPW